MKIIDITAHVVNMAGSWLTDSVISNPMSQYSEYLGEALLLVSAAKLRGHRSERSRMGLAAMDSSAARKVRRSLAAARRTDQILGGGLFGVRHRLSL